MLYSGINPADIKHGLHLGMNDYPSGYEYSGKVIAAGPKAKYKVGDTIAGHNLPGKKKPLYHGSHQDFLIGEHSMFVPPPNMALEDAACVSVMTQTAADALFNQLELPFGILGGEVPATGQAVLIWGGASNVGAAAIQIARAAGLNPILTTASRKNHEMLLKLGATWCFDYKDEDVVEQIRSAVAQTGQSLMHVFDAVGSTAPCEACCDANAVLVAALPVPGSRRWKKTLATRNVDFPITTPDGSVMWLRRNPVWQDRIDRIFQWCLDNYGHGFKVPKVRVVEGGDEGMEAMKFVADGKSSLEKIVIRHPL